jgi:hypothetical protein
MPTLSASNRTQVAYKLEGASYPASWGVFPVAGNGNLVRITGETLDYTQGTEQSKELRSDRQVTDTITVSASSQGGFNFEMSYREFDWILEGIAQSTYTEYGTSGVSAAIATLTLASGTITAGAAPTGNDAFTTLQKGQWISVIPAAGASQTVKDYFYGRAFRVDGTTAPTSTVITLDAATPINTSIAGVSLSGASISSSRLVNGNTMKSYSIEAGHLDVGQYRQYTGMIASKLDLKIGVGSIITGTVDFMGKGMTLAQATGMGTVVASKGYSPANAVRGVFDIIEGGSSITATTYIKSADITIDNSLRGQDAVGVLGNAGVAAGTIKASGKLEVYFADQTMYNKFLNNTETSLAIPVQDNAGNGYVFAFPRMKYTAAKVNAGGLDQDNMLSLDFDALMDNTATSATYQKTFSIFRVGAAT